MGSRGWDRPEVWALGFRIHLRYHLLYSERSQGEVKEGGVNKGNKHQHNGVYHGDALAHL